MSFIFETFSGGSPERKSKGATLCQCCHRNSFLGLDNITECKGCKDCRYNNSKGGKGGELVRIVKIVTR